MNRKYRKWWDGLSDLERRQHEIKLARRRFDKFVHDCRNSEVPKLHRWIEDERRLLEAAELEVGLRKHNA
jgi:hypothetical protein